MFWDAQLIYSQRVRQLKDKNIYISEDLTMAESNLFYKARQLKKKKIIHSTWTKEGKIYVRQKAEDEPIESNNDHPLLKETQSKELETSEIIQQLLSQMQSTPSRESASDKKEKASTSRHQLTETPETTTHNKENEEEESGQLSPTPPEKNKQIAQRLPRKTSHQ